MRQPTIHQMREESFIEEKSRKWKRYNTSCVKHFATLSLWNTPLRVVFQIKLRVTKCNFPHSIVNSYYKRADPPVY
jgi:hypothetical protein